MTKGFVVLFLAMVMVSPLLAAEKRLTTLKDGTVFSLEDVPEEIVVERCKGAPVRFLLAENATTGYRWKVEWNTNECSVALDRRAPDTRGGCCGAPGRMEVSIISSVYTPVRVEFRYARPWEKDVRPFKALRVIVYTVGEAKSPLYPRTAVNRLLAAECAKRGLVLTDWHPHLRGGMTPELAKAREDEFILRSSAMENHGREWEIYDNVKLRDFAVRARAVNPMMSVGIQVNDRDCFCQIDAEKRTKFSFGTNDFDPTPKDLSRWLEAIVWLDLPPSDLWQPRHRSDG